MVPGLVFGGAALGHNFIPFIGIIEFRVDTQHDPMIVKFFMMDQLTDTKLGLGFSHGG